MRDIDCSSYSQLGRQDNSLSTSLKYRLPPSAIESLSALMETKQVRKSKLLHFFSPQEFVLSCFQVSD